MRREEETTQLEEEHRQRLLAVQSMQLLSPTSTKRTLTNPISKDCNGKPPSRQGSGKQPSRQGSGKQFSRQQSVTSSGESGFSRQSSERSSGSSGYHSLYENTYFHRSNSARSSGRRSPAARSTGVRSPATRPPSRCSITSLKSLIGLRSRHSSGQSQPDQGASPSQPERSASRASLRDAEYYARLHQQNPYEVLEKRYLVSRCFPTSRTGGYQDSVVYDVGDVSGIVPSVQMLYNRLVKVLH